MPGRTYIVRLNFLMAVAATRLIAAPFEELSIAILDFEGAGMKENEIVMASDKFRASFMESSNYRIVEQTAMTDVLRARGFQQTGALNHHSSLISAGKLLDVSYILAGRFSRANGITAISARMIDVKTGEILLAKNREYRSKFYKFISTNIPSFVREFAAALEKSIKEYAEQHGKGVLFIESRPENGLIWIDSVETGKTTPATFKEMDAGKHLVRVCSGKSAGILEVGVHAGKLKKYIVNLSPAFGSLLVQSTLPGLPVTVSGKGSFNTPFQLDSLEAGEYTVESKRNDYMPYHSIVSVSACSTTALTLEVEPFSYLQLKGLAETAHVGIDGSLVNMEGATVLRLHPGTHDIQIRRAGFKDGFFTVETKPGDTSILTIEYVPLPANLSISSVPQRASIILNGKFEGRTPAIFKNRKPGLYSLMLTNRTHKPIHQQFYLKPDASLAIQDTFTQLTGEYLEWKHRQKRLHYLDLVIAGSGRALLKSDTYGMLLLGVGFASDLIFVCSTCNYYSHNRHSIHAKSKSDLEYYEDRETVDLIWAASSFTTSVLLRILASFMTNKVEF